MSIARGSRPRLVALLLTAGLVVGAVLRFPRGPQEASPPGTPPARPATESGAPPAAIPGDAGLPAPRTALAPDGSRVRGVIELLDGGTDTGGPYLGDGWVRVRLAPDTIARIPVEAGRFELGVEGAGPWGVAGLELQGLECLLVGEPMLVADVESTVRAAWPSLSVRLHVRDRLSGQELPRVCLRSVAGAEPTDGFGSAALGPDDGDPVVLESAPSPLSVTVPSGQPFPELWITHEGYRPRRYRFPTRLPMVEVHVTLEPACTLEVRVEGAPPEGARVRVHSVVDEPPRPGQPLRSFAARSDLVIPELGAERYWIALETATGAWLDAARVDLGASARERVTLSAEGGRFAAGEVTLRFSEDGRRASVPALKARILALCPPSDVVWQPGPGAFPGEDELGTWGPIALPAGDYALELGCSGQVVRFAVEPRAARTLELRVARVAPHRVSFVDARTGAPVPLRAVLWSAPTTPAGEPDLESAVGGLDAGRENPLEILAPSAPVRLMAWTSGYGEVRRRVDLRFDPDPVVQLERPACLELVPGRIDEALSVAWLAQVRVLGAHARWTIDAVELAWHDGSQRGRLLLSGTGPLELELPPLCSYGDLAPLRLELAPGEVREVVLADLVRAR